MVKSNYNCGQQELYAIARTGWNTCLTNLSSFSTFKTKYTTAFIAARIEEIAAAERLPDEEKREEQSRTARVQLSSKGLEALDKWQALKRFIIDAFPEEEQEIKLDAAGQAHYRKAAKEEWAATQRLLLDGSIFMEENESLLLLKGSMPETFRTTFATTKEEYDTLYQQYLDASVNNPVQTNTKITANNEVFDKLMNMLLDGQSLYRNNDTMKKVFTFDQMALTVGGPGVQGLKGNVTQPENLPVANAVITCTGPTVKTVTTDEDGRYECPQLKEGEYTVTVTAGGYQPATITNVEVADGAMKALDIVLIKSE